LDHGILTGFGFDLVHVIEDDFQFPVGDSFAVGVLATGDFLVGEREAGRQLATGG
jgi:hypothetical protein